jgi:hypothetical protein
MPTDRTVLAQKQARRALTEARRWLARLGGPRAELRAALQRQFPNDEARFDWFLQFREMDLSRVRMPAVAELYRQWYFIHRGTATEIPRGVIHRRERDSMQEAQRDVGAFLEHMATTGMYLHVVRDRPLTQWNFYRPGSAIADAFGPLEPGRLVRQFYGSLGEEMILYCADLLQALGANRLKACPLAVGGKDPCGRLFLARRSQKFCCRKHAVHAAVKKFYDKRGGRAKR